jgi:multidrug resistance efflux pump
MKYYFLLLLPFSLAIACNKKPENEQVENKNTTQIRTVQRIVGAGKIIPKNDIIQLSSPVSGIVASLHKKENDTVSVGTIILELEHHLEDAKLHQLYYEVSTQAEQVKVEEANREEIEVKFRNSKAELQRLQNLFSKGAETQQAVDDATTALKSLQANLKKLDASVRVSKSRLQEIKAARLVAQIQRNQKIITAPVNGSILELNVLIGGSITPQQSIAQINPEGKTIAICEIDQLYANKIKIGQKGWIRNLGSSDTLTTGTIYSAYSFLQKKSLFTDQSGEKEDRRVRTIKMMLDEPDKLLLNARVECVIDLSSKVKK